MYKPSKLIRRVRLADMDSVKADKAEFNGNKALKLLEKCEQLWMNMRGFREQRARARDFTYGDQWADIIEVDGKQMTQREYLQSTGNMVIQTNQIKNKVETIVGVMVKEKNEPLCTARDRDEQQYGEIMTAALQANCNKNKIEVLYQKFMKDLCIGGLAGAHESYEYLQGTLDSWTLYCEPNCMFLDSEMTDPRFWDMRLIGQFFDMDFKGLTARFSHSVKQYNQLYDIYHPQAKNKYVDPYMGEFTDRVDSKRNDFLQPEDNNLCRVFEVWTLETKPRYRLHDTNEGTEEIIDADDAYALRQVNEENARRRTLAAQSGWTDEETPLIEKEFFVDEYWYFRFLAPDGTVLQEGESPYPGRQHPFTICATPFVDGKIVGYMNDAIDHNIAINRAIVLQDWLTRTQAKGVTVVPKKIVPDGDYKKFANSWTSIDDMVFIDMKPGEEGLMPKVFYNTQTYNAAELINMYSRLMENSTAISGAIQGKTPYSGTSGSLYAQMAANSSTPIAALLSQFHSFLEDMHTKKMKNIAAFYDTERYKSIAGNIDGIFDNANLNLNEVGNIEYDLAIKESADTPVHRAIVNDDAKEFLMNGLITLDEYLTIAAVPYADKLLQMRQARKAEMEAAQAGQIPQQAVQESQDKEWLKDAAGVPIPKPTNKIPNKVV